MARLPKNRRSWGSDVPVSMPVPLHPDRPALVDMGGFGFTIFGIGHNLKSTDLEEYLPVFAPPPVEESTGTL